MPENGGKGGPGPGIGGILATASAFVSGIGALALTGTLGRVQRNHGTWFALSLGLLVFGVAVWLVGTLISSDAGRFSVRRRKIGPGPAVQALGVLIALAGIVTGFGTAIGTANDTEQPRLKVSVDEGKLAVVGTASADNLGSDDDLSVSVDGLVGSEESGWTHKNIGKSFVGPDGEGKAVTEIDVQVPPGVYDAVGVLARTGEASSGCGDYENFAKADGGTSCAVIRLPERPARPQLDASWGGSPLGSELTLKLSVLNAPRRKGGGPVLVALHVVGRRKGRSRTLYRTMGAPREGGEVTREIRLPVPKNLRRVCALAHLVEAGAAMPSVRCPVRSIRRNRASLDLRRP